MILSATSVSLTHLWLTKYMSKTVGAKESFLLFFVCLFFNFIAPWGEALIIQWLSLPVSYVYAAWKQLWAELKIKASKLLLSIPLAFLLQGNRATTLYGLTGCWERPFAELDGEKWGNSRKPSDFVSAQLSCCRNESLIILFFPCSLPFHFLLLEPWSSSKWVLLCTPDDLRWQKWSKLPIKGYNC